MLEWLKKHTIFLSVSSIGFIFLFVFLYFEYSAHNNDTGVLIRDLRETRFRTVLMHIMVFLAPLLSTLFAFLFERTHFYKKSLEQKVEAKTASLRASEEKLRKLSEDLELKVEERTARLQESARYWRDTFDSTPYGIFIMDKDYTILRINRQITQLLGKGYDEIEGKKCYEIFHSSDHSAKECPLVKSLSSGKIESAEFYEPAVGRYLWIQTTPVMSDGETEAFIHSIVDVTDMKEKEKSLEKSRDAFLNMLKDIHESYDDLKELFISLIRAFIHALDAKSRWTKGHSERVTMYAVEIAVEMGFSKDKIEDIRIAGMLHDIGKIGTYDYLLDKPENLTDEEFSMVKKHPGTAAVILGDIKQLKDILPIIKHHHERYDGRGYPEGLKGEDIPLGARILCAADSFDSMTADRPYRPAPGMEYAKSELIKFSGKQFDPKVVEAFLKILESAALPAAT